MAARVATKEMRHIRRDQGVGSALKRAFAIAWSFSGWPAVMRVRRKISSAKDASVPPRAIAPIQ